MYPNITEILPGLVRFTIPFPNDQRRNVHSYVFFGDQEALLLDASWDVPEAHEALRETLQRHGLDEDAVRTVLITHLHPDHLGMAPDLRQRRAQVGYHPAETILLSRFHDLEELRVQSALWERLNGAPPELDLAFRHIDAVARTLSDIGQPDLALTGDRCVEVGSFRIRPVWTPGHTLGHLCYYEETQRLLFTGDHVLPTITPHVGMYVHVISNPLPNYLDSLNLLRAFSPSLVLPAHGEPFTDLYGRLDELVEHHHERMEELFSLVDGGPVSAWEVAYSARWTRRRVTLDDIAPRHRRLALAETLAHLELLRAEGRLAKVFGPEGMRYRRP